MTTQRIAAFLALAVLATGIGFGATTLARGSSGAAPVSSTIPSPAPGSGPFVEGDDLTAQDNQSNILAGAAQGLVHILSGPTATGIGLVLTPSGKALTSAAAVAGTGRLSSSRSMWRARSSTPPWAPPAPVTTCRSTSATSST